VKTNKLNWIIDAVLLAGFLVTFFLDLTGLEAHQWLGLAVGLLAGYHLVLHWDWVKSVTARFVQKTSRQARYYYVIDAGLVLGFALILVTGLVISSWLNLPLEDYIAWKNVHVISSVITLLIVVVKIGLHWRWIIKTAQRFVEPSRASAGAGPALQPAVASTSMARRQFLILMGAVGIPAVLAATRVLEVEQMASAAAAGQTPMDSQALPAPTGIPSPSLPVLATQSAGAVVASPTTAPQTQSLPDASSSSCTVRCSNGCSYPGRCRRYVDTNRNNLCDLGECM